MTSPSDPLKFSPPTVLSETIIASTQLFDVWSVELAFSNGQRRTFERLKSKANDGFVVLLAVNDKDELLLIKEYATAMNQYVIGLPRGGIKKGMSAIETAHLELAEEVKVGAHTLEELRLLRQAPSYSGAPVHFMLATHLFERHLDGDEPEPLEVIPWPLSRLDELMERMIDVHSVLGLQLLKEYRGRS